MKLIESPEPLTPELIARHLGAVNGALGSAFLFPKGALKNNFLS